jgi:hypothetical protein
MRTARVPVSTVCLVVLLSLTGCVMSSKPMKAPAAEGSVPVPAGIDTEMVLACAETSVRTLHDRNELWNIRVTRRDAGRGELQTGDFDDDNIGGFRISVQHGPETDAVRIRLKAAGPYFMDLGAEKAFADLDAQMRQCLSSKQGG